eukprot:scaffold100668_cov26-Tisochrysis_lutea.AAC.1
MPPVGAPPSGEVAVARDGKETKKPFSSGPLVYGYGFTVSHFNVTTRSTPTLTLELFTTEPPKHRTRCSRSGMSLMTYEAGGSIRDPRWCFAPPSCQAMSGLTLRTWRAGRPIQAMVFTPSANLLSSPSDDE